MTVDDFIHKATKKLEQAGIGTARLDSLVLLEDVTGLDRAHLLAEPDMEITSQNMAQLEKLLNQRMQHVPLAYVRGKTEFYGREFVVNPAALEPRPESEALIDVLKALIADGSLIDNSQRPLRIADVGAGSGALGITAVLEVPNCQVELLEIDQKALEVAKINVDKFTLPLAAIKSDLLEGSSQDYGLLLCNLPYVPDGYPINQAAKHEPRLALFGGSDGLDVYRKLFEQLENRPQRPLFLLLESLPSQHRVLQQIALKSGYKLVKTEHFAQAYKSN